MKKHTTWDVVVIGGGPAGMMAAGRAGERGKRVLLLEKNPTLGKKLLITGGGRCNVTNNKTDIRTMLARYKGNSKFLFSAFAQFAVTETIEFFRQKGMTMKEENDGRLFPVSNSARSVWDVLTKYMKENSVTIMHDADVTKISYDESRNEITVTLRDKTLVHAHVCVVATGGTSRPETGSTGDGFHWLKKLGHTIIQNEMALVPIALKNPWVKRVAGVSLEHVRLTAFVNGKRKESYKGRLLFTHVGITGPMVLNMSKDVGVLLRDTEGSEYVSKKTSPSEGETSSLSVRDVTLELDIFPQYDHNVLRQRLQEVLTKESNKKIKNVLSLLVPPSFVETFLFLANVDLETPCHSVRTEERKRIIQLLKSLPLNVKGLLGKDKAVVSSGGVELSEVNFKTMQSRILPQLYLVGDVLNIDRPSGGYSLQLCWTTGYVAGSNV